MVVRLSGVPGTLVLIVIAVGGAMAQPAFFPEASDALPANEERTYLDLLRLVIPGISVSDTTYSGGRPIGIRHLQGWKGGGVEIPPTGDLRLAAVPARSSGMDRMALLIEFGETEFAGGFAILALFDVDGEPRLLDAADVASDRWTSFMDPARLPVGAGDDLLVTQSTHHNSSQGYMTVALTLVRGDRFELVDTIALLSDRECTFERSQQFSIEQGAGEPFADIVATVMELTTPTAEDCGKAVPEPRRRSIAVTYRWDSAALKYSQDSDAFENLARENEERF